MRFFVVALFAVLVTAVAQAPNENSATAENSTDVNWKAVISDTRATNSTEVVSTLFRVLNLELHRKHLQWVNAIVAMVFGAVMLYDGLHMFKLFVLVIMYFSVYLVSVGDVTSAYPAAEGSLWIKVLSFEIACFISFFAWDSFPFIQKMIGFCLGFFCFNKIHIQLANFAAVAGSTWIRSSPMLIVIATLCFCTGTWLFAEGPSYVWALIASVAGSVLMSSGIWFFATLIQGSGSAVSPAWWDFVITLNPWSKYPAVGPFTNGSMGLPAWLPMNRLVNLLMAFVLFVVAFYIQYSKAKKEKDEYKKQASLCKNIRDFLMCRNCAGSFSRQKTTDFNETLIGNDVSTGSNTLV